jgi:hypothetical protein
MTIKEINDLHLKTQKIKNMDYRNLAKDRALFSKNL